MAKIGKRLKAGLAAVDREAAYAVADAMKIVKEHAKAKFDETVEVAINLGVDPKHADQMVRGVVALPHGSGKTMRVHRNPYVDDWEKRPQDIQPFPQQAIISTKANVMGGIGGQIEGLDINKSCFAMGQGAGAIREVLSAKEIVENTMHEAEEVLARLKKYA